MSSPEISVCSFTLLSGSEGLGSNPGSDKFFSGLNNLTHSVKGLEVVLVLFISKKTSGTGKRKE